MWHWMLQRVKLTVFRIFNIRLRPAVLNIGALVFVATIALCWGCSSVKDVSQTRSSIAFQSTPLAPPQEQSNPMSGTASRERNPLQTKQRFAELVAAHNRAVDDWGRKLQAEIKRVGVQQALLEKIFKLDDMQIQTMEHGRPSGTDAPGPEGKLGMIGSLFPFCRSGPFLFGPQVADFPLYWEDFYLPANVIVPGARMVLIGCNLGNVPGKATLTLTASGQQFDLPIDVDSGGWSDYIIWVDVPDSISGVLDQKAELQIVDSANRMSNSVDAQFVATRDTQRFDSDVHRDLVAIDAECPRATTDDSCGGASVGDLRWPDGRSIVVVHWKSCCRKVTGSDTFYLNLKNGWTLPTLDPVFGNADGFKNNSGEDDYEWAGLTTCWWFGNKPGYAFPTVGQASSQPGYTVQVSFNWHVDSVCSGVHYDTNIYLMGPIGVNYW